MKHKTNDEEISFFNSISNWWGKNSDMLPLHQMNEARLLFIRETLEKKNGIPLAPQRLLENQTVLDVGCGGGLVAEPLARLGACVTGLDASHASIEAARRHAAAMNLDIRYVQGTLEALSDDEQFDVVFALEIVEHVENPAEFISNCLARVKPGGLLFLSTMNRTRQAYWGGILFAERVLKWLPKGAHDWYKFLKPSEVRRFIDLEGASIIALSGINFNPWQGTWSLSEGMKINYILAAQKASCL